MILKNTRTAVLAFALALSVSLPASADGDVPALQPFAIRGDFSGTWFDPAHPGQGVMVEVIDGNQAAVAWYTFDPHGTPLWLYGMGRIDGATLQVALQRVTGGVFPPASGPGNVEVQPWGEATLRFTGCDAGSIAWMPVTDESAPGEMPLLRATGLHGTRCNVEEEFAEQRIYAFERGTLGFEVEFADYPPGQDAFYELDYAFEPLPEPLSARRGVRLSGNNHSDDLAMLVKAPMGGLLPDTVYRLELEVEIASNVPSNCMGTGGSPGESVWIKLGASTEEPFAITEGDGSSAMKRLNIDYGVQGNSGADARIVGTMGNGHDCGSDDVPWTLRSLSTRGEVFAAKSDADGVLWLIAGTDSGFESRTDVYFTALRVRLEPAPLQ